MCIFSKSMTMSSLENVKQQKHEKPNIKGDRLNITILIFMYILQGAVGGLIQAFSIIFQNRKVSYADQVRIIL